MQVFQPHPFSHIDSPGQDVETGHGKKVTFV